ncbi:MAG: Crp/Fnr family transcriptional regulator [Selenomonas sp.]|uniref:Crp/Fnr family transcriptional regulator n=1 Tax=Selenomonas sp. TaxID=2053611 RepID=UPI0025F172A8|nr:Crp/Fnr family transcriptional regulator [Selenomonas sp.]MCR5757393.1 Crp/Fnr family transcriptional regulator [Selenomonas sp.]
MTLKELCRQNEKVLMACPLFAGISIADYPAALEFLQAKAVNLAKHELVQQLGEPFRHAAIVLKGRVEGSFLNENDAKIAVSRFGAGQFFGEALACVQPASSPIQIETLQDSCLLLLNITTIQEEKGQLTGIACRLALNLIQTLAWQNVYQNRKIRILSQKKLRDRIGIFLREMPRQPDGSVLVKQTNTSIAEFLGVNRSALSRELGLMQDEGVLRIEGKKYFLA